MSKASLWIGKRQFVNAARRTLSAVLPYHPLLGGKERLDAEYAAGVWDYLRGLDEVARFGVVAAYCHFLKKDGSILEIGCGEGVLQERLDASMYARYIGLDISEEAISRASHKQNEKVHFIVGDAEAFKPAEKFDIIVFNECLEYFDEPDAVVKRFEQFLNPNSFFVVSMFDGLDTVRTKHIWKSLAVLYDSGAEARVSNQSGYAWTIKVLSPADTPPQ